MSAQWLPVPGYEGRYQVSEDGKVANVRTGAELSSWNDVDGYRRYTLYKTGKKKNLKASRLVALAFLGEPPSSDKNLVLHCNGVNTDDRVSNLRWGTVSENSLDMVKHGTHPKASRESCANGHEYEEGSYRVRRGSRECKRCVSMFAERTRNRLKGSEPPDSAHGTLNGYVAYQCRCSRCKTTWSSYQKGRRGQNVSTIAVG